MIGSYARMMQAPGYEFGRTQENFEAFLHEIEHDWGKPVGLALRAPSRVSDESFRGWWARFLRASASPRAAADLLRMNNQIDVRHVLPSIRVPTLVLHSVGDLTLPVEGSRYLARMIPGANLVELPGEDHLPYLNDAEAILDEVEEFLTGVRRHAETERVLATVLFTDIVGATEKAARLGDRRWRELLESHHQVVRRELARFRGREIDTAGDGFFAAFDGPARAVRCARAVASAVQPLGIEVRAGAHTGECEVMGDKIGGIAVHIGARVAACAGPSEVLVSSTVKDLEVPVAGGVLRGSVVGDGDPVLLLHGGPGLPCTYLQPLVDELAAGYRVAGYQQRGLPPSTAGAPYDVRTQVADVVAVLDALGWERPVVAGHSWGGHLLLHLLAERPQRLAGALVIDTLGGVGDGGETAFDAELMRRTPHADVARVKHLEEEAMAGRGADADLMESMRLLWPAYFADPAAAPPFPDMSFSVEAYAATFASLHEALPGLAARLAGVAAPTLFVHGAASPMPVTASTDSAEAIGAAAAVEVLEDAGHFPWIERPGSIRAALDRLS